MQCGTKDLVLSLFQLLYIEFDNKLLCISSDFLLMLKLLKVIFNNMLNIASFT